MEIIFNRQIRCITHGVFKTAVDRDNDGIVVNAFYRHSHLKYYLKDHRALRVETVINDTHDLGLLRRIEHFDGLVATARAANHRFVGHYPGRSGVRCRRRTCWSDRTRASPGHGHAGASPQPEQRDL